MNEATTGLHALYSVGLSGVSGTASRRSSLLIPSLSNAVVDTKLGAAGGNVSHKPIEDNDSIASIEDVSVDSSERILVNGGAATTSFAAESLKSALSAPAVSKVQSSQTSMTAPDKPGLIVIARAMFAARVYGAAERAGIVGTRDDNKKRAIRGMTNQAEMKSQGSSDREPATDVSRSSKTLASPSTENPTTAKQGVSDDDNQECHGILQDTSIHEDNIAIIRARMDALLSERNDDEQYFTRELVSLQSAFDKAQHDLACARAENDALRAGAIRDDAETTRLREALRVAERRALALTFDVDKLLREGTRRAGQTVELEAELEDAKEEAARARALVEEMRRRLEALVGMQRSAGVATEKVSRRGLGSSYAGPSEDREVDPTRLGALARLANQKLDSSFVIGSDDSDDEIGSTDVDEGVLGEMKIGDLSADIQQELALLPQEPRGIALTPLDTQHNENSEDSIIIVTDMDTKRLSVPPDYSSRAVPIEQPRPNSEFKLKEVDVKGKDDELSVQPIPVFHTSRPSLPPRIPKTAPVNAPNRLRSKPSLQRMAISNARRVSDQKFNAIRKNAAMEMRNQTTVNETMEGNEHAGSGSIPAKHSRLKPLLLAARFAAAASVASRRKRADSCVSTVPAEPANGKNSTTSPKPLNPSAQEFTPRRSPQPQDFSDTLPNLSIERMHMGTDMKATRKTDDPKPDISSLVLTPNPNTNMCTPRTTRAISVQILSSRAAARERELARAVRTSSGEDDVNVEKFKLITSTGKPIASRRERERAADSRVVSCPARAFPVRVRVSTRLPLALFAERDLNDPTSPMRYEFRPILPNSPGIDVNLGANAPLSGSAKSKCRTSTPNAATGTARVVSAPAIPSVTATAARVEKTDAHIPRITCNNGGAGSDGRNRTKKRSPSGEILVAAQRRLERNTRKSFNAVGPSSFWRACSDSSTMGSDTSYRALLSPRSSTRSGTSSSSFSGSPKTQSRKASGKGAAGGTKGQKTRLVGKGRPARRGAFNELTNVSGIAVGDAACASSGGAEAVKEPGRWLSA